MSAFISGEHPGPRLLRFMAISRFHTINEACVEGLHATVKRGISGTPRYGPVHVALIHHFSPIKALLDDSASFRPFAEACDAVRRPADIVRHFGLERHPVIAEVLSRPGMTTDKLSRYPYRSMVLDVLYRIDAHSLYEDVSYVPSPKPATVAEVPQHLYRE